MTPTFRDHELDFDMDLYAEAERFLEKNADDLRGMALLAYQHRGNPKHLRQLSFQWARSARRMAAAVSRWPQWFLETDGMPPLITEVDEAIALFALAAVPEVQAEQMKAEWKDRSLRAWQIEELISRWKDAEAVIRGEVTKLKSHATIREFGEHTVILGWTTPQVVGPEAEALWIGKRVRVTLVLDES